MLHPLRSAYYRLHGRPCRSRRERAAQRQEATGERSASPTPRIDSARAGWLAHQRCPNVTHGHQSHCTALDSDDSRLVKECHLLLVCLSATWVWVYKWPGRAYLQCLGPLGLPLEMIALVTCHSPCFWNVTAADQLRPYTISNLEFQRPVPVDRRAVAGGRRSMAKVCV